MILVCPECESRFKVKPEAIGDSGRVVKCAKCGHKWKATKDELQEPGSASPKTATKKAPSKAAAKTASPKKASGAKTSVPKADAPKADAPKAKQPDPAPDLESASEADSAVEETDVALPPMEDFSNPPKSDPGDTSSEGDDEDDFTPPPPPPMADEADMPPLPPPDLKIKPRKTVPVKRQSPLKAWIALGVILVILSSAFMLLQGAITEAYPPAIKIYKVLGLPVDELGYGLELPQPQAEALRDGEERKLVISGVVENTTDEPVDIPLLRGSLKNTDGEDLYSWAFKPSEAQAFPGETIAYETTIPTVAGATSIEISFTTLEEVEASGIDQIGIEGDAAQ